VLPPDDPYKQFELALANCKKLLTDAQANLGSTDQGLRDQAAETMRHLGDLAKAIATGSSPPTTDYGVERTSIGSLVGLMPTIRQDAAHNARPGRRALADEAIAAMDQLAGLIARAQKQTGGRIA
jgi:hypothetical protein